jgi:hypothetical protein
MVENHTQALKVLLVVSVVWSLSLDLWEAKRERDSRENLFRNLDSADFDPTSPGPEDRKYTIHGISHSHMDIGWRETYQWYFDDIVKHIISKTVQRLSGCGECTFTHANAYFIKKWLKEHANEEEKRQLKELL